MSVITPVWSAPAGGINAAATSPRAVALPPILVHAFRSILPSLVSEFRAIDTDQSGCLSRAEFALVLAQQGLSPTQADALFASLDVSGDGSVSARTTHGARPPCFP